MSAVHPENLQHHVTIRGELGGGEAKGVEMLRPKMVKFDMLKLEMARSEVRGLSRTVRSEVGSSVVVRLGVV